MMQPGQLGIVQGLTKPHPVKNGDMCEVRELLAKGEPIAIFDQWGQCVKIGRATGPGYFIYVFGKDSSRPDRLWACLVHQVRPLPPPDQDADSEKGTRRKDEPAEVGA